MLGDPVCESRAEVFVFKEGSRGCVYKRVWEDVKEGLRVCGEVVVTVSVEAEGTAGKEEGRWLQVELGRSKDAGVWVSERWWDTKMNVRTRTMGDNNNEEEEKEKEVEEEEEGKEGGDNCGEGSGQSGTLFGRRGRTRGRSTGEWGCDDIFPICESDDYDMMNGVYVGVDDSLWPF